MLVPCKVDVDSKILKQFRQLCSSLQVLVHVVKTEVDHERVCLHDLKEFLSFIYPHTEVALESAISTREVFDVVKKECTLLNYDILIAIAERFELESALKRISEFTPKEEEYRRLLLDEKFVKKLQEMCEHFSQDQSHKLPVSLKVKWTLTADVIEKFKQLLNEELPEVARYLHLEVVREGCFVFVCYCPLQLEGVVTRLVQEKKKGLQRKGVIRVVVGEMVVMDTVSKEEEEMHELVRLLER